MKLKSSGINWIGLIPEEWNIGRLKYAIKCLDYRRIPVDKNLRVDGPYPYWGAGKIMGYVDKYIFDEDIVLLGEDGAPFFDPTRDVAHRVSYPCWVNNHIHVLTAATGFDNGFLKHYLNSVDYGSYINGSILNKLTQENMNNIALCYPDISEQRLIADFLDERCAEIDKLSEDIQKQIGILEDYKKTIITRAVTKGLNPSIEMKYSETGWLGLIPSHWNTKRISALYSLRNIKVSDEEFPPLSVTMKGILPQLENVAKTDDHSNRKLVRRGDFVINSRSDRRGSCGISGYDGSVSLINTVLKPNGTMNNEYYNWLFHTPIFADEYYKWGHGIVDDLWTTNWQDMKVINVPVPPISEQMKIAEYLNEICEKIDASVSGKQEQYDKLISYKKSIVYEYATGKKRVKGAL